MSTTPQGSALNQDDLSLANTSGSEQYISIDGDSDCRRTETFDLPIAKKFKSTTNIHSNGNGSNITTPMEHTNGVANHNGVSSKVISNEQ